MSLFSVLDDKAILQVDHITLDRLATLGETTRVRIRKPAEVDTWMELNVQEVKR